MSHQNNKQNAWSVYILQCGNGTLYTGVTTDVPRRLDEHASGGPRSARFTRAFAPVTLVYSCLIGPKRLAHRVEYRLKRLCRENKTAVAKENFSKTELLNLLGMEE